LTKVPHVGKSASIRPCNPALIVNGKGKATVYAVTSKWSCVKHLTLVLTTASLPTWPRTHSSIPSVQTAFSLPQSTETGLKVPGTFEWMWWSMMRCVEVCTEFNVSGHMLIWTFFLAFVCGTWAQSLSTPFSYFLYIICKSVHFHTSSQNFTRSPYVNSQTKTTLTVRLKKKLILC
jgi:hypothetical protein